MTKPKCTVHARATLPRLRSTPAPSESRDSIFFFAPEHAVRIHWFFFKIFLTHFFRIVDSISSEFVDFALGVFRLGLVARGRLFGDNNNNHNSSYDETCFRSRRRD